MEKLIDEVPLEPRHRNHRLSGKYGGHWECHIEPDWLLIYLIEPGVIKFVSTGSHADLFG
jgi:mRNA interferase YafQ